MENTIYFVHGTLRRHSTTSNGHLLVENAEFIGHAQVKGHLYQVSYYPVLCKVISGLKDVYACAADLWPILDEFEETAV